MRELRFRAWFEDEMIFSDCPTGEFDFVFDGDGNMEFVVWNDEKHKLTPDGDVVYSGWDTYTADIMQYTGLKDVDGKDIYEGDIVIKPANKQRPLEVVFADDIGCFEAVHPVGARTLSGYVNTAGGVLIIGNIYENKELLDVI